MAKIADLCYEDKIKVAGLLATVGQLSADLKAAEGAEKDRSMEHKRRRCKLRARDKQLKAENERIRRELQESLALVQLYRNRIERPCVLDTSARQSHTGQPELTSQALDSHRGLLRQGLNQSKVDLKQYTLLHPASKSADPWIEGMKKVNHSLATIEADLNCQRQTFPERKLSFIAMQDVRDRPCYPMQQAPQCGPDERLAASQTDSRLVDLILDIEAVSQVDTARREEAALGQPHSEQQEWADRSKNASGWQDDADEVLSIIYSTADDFD